MVKEKETDFIKVNLRDINDNAPIFPSNLIGSIDENREPGSEFH